jgi:post-segregation antitoxin (ccd killing protein)
MKVIHINKNIVLEKKLIALFINADLLQKERQKWLKESQEAIEKQNNRIKQCGTFSDDYRRF